MNCLNMKSSSLLNVTRKDELETKTEKNICGAILLRGDKTSCVVHLLLFDYFSNQLLDNYYTYSLLEEKTEG